MKNWLKSIQDKKIESIKSNPNPSAHREIGWYVGLVISLIATTIMYNLTSIDTKIQVVINLVICLLVFWLLEMLQDKVLDGSNNWKEKAFDIKDYMVNAMLFCFLFPLIFNFW